MSSTVMRGAWPCFPRLLQTVITARKNLGGPIGPIPSTTRTQQPAERRGPAQSSKPTSKQAIAVTARPHTHLQHDEHWMISRKPEQHRKNVRKYNSYLYLPPPPHTRTCSRMSSRQRSSTITHASTFSAPLLRGSRAWAMRKLVSVPPSKLAPPPASQQQSHVEQCESLVT